MSETTFSWEEKYISNCAYDEMYQKGTQNRASYAAFFDQFSSNKSSLKQKSEEIEDMLWHLGMTFNLYLDNQPKERVLPLDVIPRILDYNSWSNVEKGLKQRVRALNLFLQDIYNDQHILNDKIIDPKYIFSSKCYLEACKGITPARGVWAHITGTDLIQQDDGQFYVLEDNLRCPSGVSYVLENREIFKRAYTSFFKDHSILPVSDYPERLLTTLKSLSGSHAPQCGVLSPGIYNSAYFEHSFLAKRMGIDCLIPEDLEVKDDHVYLRTTKGLKKIDVLYRRIDDIFLDPKVFRPDSLLGVPGIFNCFKKGNVSLANAPGTGVADDKVVYSFVPKMISYYLKEDPILPNIDTYICSEKDQLNYVLDNLEKLVVKPTNESGGYGIFIGPKSTKKETKEFKEVLLADVDNYIAQPTIYFSTTPTYVDKQIQPRYVDLRPFILMGEDIDVVPGGLSRVALKKNSLVVNSSQGGGSKDTWIIKPSKKESSNA